MFWNTSPGRRPIIQSERAIRSVHVARSRRVWKTAVGRPVVPEEECSRTSLSRPTVSSP